MEQINLSIDFVSASVTQDASANVASQTGDPLSWLWILGLVLFTIVSIVGIFLYKKFSPAQKFRSNSNYYKIRNAKHVGRIYSFSREGIAVLGAIFILVLSVLLAGIFSTRTVFALPSSQDLTPDTDKIIASIHDDGSITFSTCNLKNTSDKLITLDKAIVDVADEAKSVAAIHTCDLTINSFDGCIFKGMPNGQEHQVTGCSSLDVGESTPFSLTLTNLDKQSAMELCGKRVFTLKLRPQVSTVYNLATDGNGSWTEDGKTVTSFEVPGEDNRPTEGEIITYTGLDRKSHSVKATPTLGYWFLNCTYGPQNNTYSATFNMEKYSITYCDQGGGNFTGTHDNNYPTQHIYGVTTNLKGATKAGYTFDGWYKDQDCSGSKVTVIDASTMQAVTLYAKWIVNQYTITFDTQGGSAVATITQDYGSSITAPADPTKTGSTFAGWTPSVPATMPAGDLTCIAQWTINKHTVTFDANGHGTAPPAYTNIEYGSKFANPGIVSGVEGYSHDGKWYKEAACTNEWNFTTDTMPDDDLTLYAKWLCICTVSYIMNGHGTQVPSQTVEQGDKATEPTPPTEEEYKFAGWYTSNEFTDQNLYNFDTPVTSSFTLYARWKGAAEIIFQYGESYDNSLSDKGWEGSTNEYGGVVYKYFDLGTRFTDVLAEWNNSSTGKVTAATKTGYDFKDFYIWEEQQTQTTITDDETLWNIQWTPQEYYINYYDQGGVAYTGDNKTELIKKHIYDKDTELVGGVKAGYSFDGWYTSSACTGNPVKNLGAKDFTEGPINLYAKWTKIILKYKATVIKGEGEIFNDTELSGKGWKKDASENWYKEFNSDTPYSTILAEWGDSSSWSTATSITRPGMTLTGFTPSSGTLSQDTEFSAQWTANTEYTFTASFKIKPAATVKYVVSLWGLNHDGQNTGTFGPATDPTSCPNKECSNDFCKHI